MAETNAKKVVIVTNTTDLTIVKTTIEEAATTTILGLTAAEMMVLPIPIVTDPITKAAESITIDNKADGMEINSQIEEITINKIKITDNIRVVLLIVNQVVIALGTEATMGPATVVMATIDLAHIDREVALLIKTFDIT